MKIYRSGFRLALLALAMLSLTTGVLAGLARLGWSVPPRAAAASGWHGALMISCFFGAVISLERAVAIGRGWAYLAPAAAGLGGAALLAGAPLVFAQMLALGAAAILVTASMLVLQRLVAPFTLVLALAAACWLIGNIAWLASGNAISAVPFWLGFLVLTIAGERLELTRFLPTPRAAQHLFHLIVANILLGAATAFWREAAGLAWFAVSLLALALWLLRYDIARHNARQRGMVRFIAICLLSGYGWLLLAGLLGTAGGLVAGHAWRDATLHAVTLGFVFSMIFGHTPIIFPAVAQVKIPYHAFFYLPLIALHATLALRIAGSLGDNFALRQAAGMGNAVVLLLFIVTMLFSIVRGKRRQPGAARSVQART